MADISISLSNVQNIKTVDIEGLGVFRVRKLGAGEELDLSTKTRRLMHIMSELSNVDFNDFNLTTEEGRKAQEKQIKKVDKLSSEITDIKRFELSTYKKCFTDDKGGSAVDDLMNMLSVEERSTLFKQIFDAPKVIEAPESVQPKESAVASGEALEKENDNIASKEVGSE